MPFLEYLVDKGVITKYHVDGLIPLIQSGQTLDTAATSLKIDTAKIRSARSSYYGFPEGFIPEGGVKKDVLNMIPEAASKTYKIVPLSLSVDGKTLQVGIVDPGNTESLNAIQFLFLSGSVNQEISVITEADFTKVYEGYSRMALESTTGTDTLGAITEDESGSQVEDGLDLNSNTNDLEFKSTDADEKAGEKQVISVDAPAVRAFNVIIQNALDGGASDIHIEATEKDMRIRYRLDGDLFNSLSLPKSMHPAVVARVKILTKTMKLDEKRKPQDGRFYAMIDGRKVDFRVSTMPTFFGEKVVIRILDQGAGTKGIEKMGFLPDHLEMVQRAITLPYGMVLVTGPTGSGKSTTLYSMLAAVDKIKKNVVSLEDPVEYNMEGVSQSQVQSELGYTFASGLRSILRQDPDVIMVGEIRDKETAQLAIQAALTGHLVFSTLHTNTAIGAIARLIDMGVDPYLIPPVVRLLVAQRLVHKMNPSVPSKKIAIEGSVRQIVDNQFKDLPEQYRKEIKMGREFHDADPDASGSVSGRIAVFEMLEMNRELEELILKNPTEPAIYAWARERGMRSVREDAMIKSSQGIVPWSEVHDL
jgi:type II secretory ATPase GspE/PulE/Tfp pilus assembly ATPase PilB-like protein